MTISVNRLNKPQSIYERIDYIVNSDMSIPFALARSVVTAAQSEAARRTGFPPVDRAPQVTPLGNARARIRGSGRG